MAPSRSESATRIPKTLRALMIAPSGPRPVSSLPRRAEKVRRMGTLPRRAGTKKRLLAFELATATVSATALALAHELEEAQARFEEELRGLAPLTTAEEAALRDPRPLRRDEQIERLEQESQRLAALLAETERQRDEARATLASLQRTRGAAPVPSNQKAPSGISGDDPRRDAKMAIIKELLEQNRELRRALATTRADEPPPPDASAPEALPLDATAAEDEPLVDPDDLPWQPSAEATSAGGTGQVKATPGFKRL